MKTILIPTDFSVQSLDLIKNAILNFPNQKVNIVLALGKKSMVSDFEPMIFLGLRNSETIERTFVSKKNKLHLEHKNQISRIQIEVFTGTNKYAFDNFLVANNITDALLPMAPFRNFNAKNYFCLSHLIQANMDKVVKVDNFTEEPTKKEFVFKVTSILDRVNL